MALSWRRELAHGHRSAEQGRGGLHLHLPAPPTGLVRPVQGEPIQQLGGASGWLTGGEGFQNQLHMVPMHPDPGRVLVCAAADFVLA